MHHLIQTRTTHKLLNDAHYQYLDNLGQQVARVASEKPPAYVTMAFFFSFRAGHMEANDVTGLVKLFLSKLSAQNKYLEKALAVKHAERDFSEYTQTEFVALLCDTVRLADTRICAFIDGLDEYKGSHTELANTLRRIQDRTDMKMLIASRPEAAFTNAFADLEYFQMQDHNEHSIRVYIEDAIQRGRETLLDIDTVLDRAMQDEILRRAEGVIIWARLAIDELFRAAREQYPKVALMEILESLPSELEEMYDLTLSRQNDLQKSEAALTLCIIDRLGGFTPIGVLRGAWDFCFHYLPALAVVNRDQSEESFKARMLTLLGSFVDHVVAYGESQLCLMHRTLVAYLHRSTLISTLLPIDFRVEFPHNQPVIFYTAVITQACSDMVKTKPQPLWWDVHHKPTIPCGLVQRVHGLAESCNNNV